MVECKSLKKTDIIGKSDPYVRVYLMPGTHMELKTKIVKNNLNPVYNDEFTFTVCIYFYIFIFMSTKLVYCSSLSMT